MSEGGIPRTPSLIVCSLDAYGTDGSTQFRMILCTGPAMPVLVAALVWNTILQCALGTLNAILGLLGLTHRLHMFNSASVRPNWTLPCPALGLRSVHAEIECLPEYPKGQPWLYRYPCSPSR